MTKYLYEHNYFWNFHHKLQFYFTHVFLLKIWSFFCCPLLFYRKCVFDGSSLYLYIFQRFVEHRTCVGPLASDLLTVLVFFLCCLTNWSQQLNVSISPSPRRSVLTSPIPHLVSLLPADNLRLNSFSWSIWYQITPLANGLNLLCRNHVPSFNTLPPVHLDSTPMMDT